MRNRAKCKLCLTVLESFHQYDYVSCKCGEISITGGGSNYECSAKNWENFLRIDENDNEIVPKVIDKEEKNKIPQENPNPITFQECIDLLEIMVKNIEKLPNHALSAPVTNLDFYNYLTVILEIFKHKDKK
jgi:HKD family nuclease